MYIEIIVCKKHCEMCLKAPVVFMTNADALVNLLQDDYIIKKGLG